MGYDTEDAAVREALAQMLPSLDAATLRNAYLTLLALFILEEAYADYEDEWELIARKARTFLQGLGVQKPNTLIKKFTLTVIN